MWMWSFWENTALKWCSLNSGNSQVKWLHNGIIHPSNWFKQILETRMTYCTCTQPQLEKMQISQECGQISHYFLCTSSSKKSKLPSKRQNLLGMTIPEFPIFLESCTQQNAAKFEWKQHTWLHGFTDIKLLSVSHVCCFSSYFAMYIVCWRNSLGKWQSHSIVQHVRFGSKQIIIPLTVCSVCVEPIIRLWCFTSPAKKPCVYLGFIWTHYWGKQIQ